MRRLAGGADLRVTRLRPERVDRRARVARDTLTILGGALAAILAWQFVGGATPGPGDGSIRPGGTEIAGGSFEGRPTTRPLHTLGPIANASIGLDATPTPVPFATLGPTTLKVVMAVTNDNGGNDVAPDWTITIRGASLSPSVFRGSASGTTIALDPGKTFTISTTPKTAGGYVESRSGTCSGSVTRGASATCRIAENDRPVSLTVTVRIDNTGGGGATPDQVSVMVNQSGSTVASFTGDHTPRLVLIRANTGWTVAASAPLFASSYTATTSSGCQSSGAREGAIAGCTITFTYVPPPTPTSS